MFFTPLLYCTFLGKRGVGFVYCSIYIGSRCPLTFSKVLIDMRLWSGGFGFRRPRQETRQSGHDNGTVVRASLDRWAAVFCLVPLHGQLFGWLQAVPPNCTARPSTPP
ncbi:hypothetical protein GGR51DRAFT_518850 [Nemania sp. FL0031]|nr:hypothetical protein GGR51DRAFT_518850 [Nemania sp. FL0031]